MDIATTGWSLSNLAKVNVVLGKNGAGKSTLLRTLEQQKASLPNIGNVRYITPERGGQLVYDGGIETSMLQLPNWSNDIRRSNRYENFRQMSVTEFRRLETLVLRKIEKDIPTRENMDFSFDTTLASINRLLDHVRLVRGDSVGFEIRAKDKDEVRNAGSLSSGESELASLAIEILSFAYATESLADKDSFLFLDEPDVHLHPDLQERLVQLLLEAIEGRNITVVIATHSTSVLSALAENAEARVGFLVAGQKNLGFVSIGTALRRILPIFGAHPLSSVFNNNPILLVEGEDDERVWQQAVRSTRGELKLWPCSAGDIQSLDAYEDEVASISSSLYDNPKAYSLRDRDGQLYEIEDKPVVKRTRLYCRTAENLLLSDDVLSLLGIDWTILTTAMNDWLLKYPEHPQSDAMMAFKSTGYDRLNADVKSLRNIFMMLAGSQKPWEVAVGQAIAGILSGKALTGDHSLTAYLGPKLIQSLNLRPTVRQMFSRKSRYA